MDGIARTIGAKLTAQKWRISVAESCTGGLVCKLITDVEGSSAWFDRGFISYTNESKMAMLNVARETLDKHGAVSLQTVEAMAYGALSNSRANLALAISGIAGPGGGTPDKPVGTVCFAWMDESGKCLSEVRLFSGNRQDVRLQAANYALCVASDRFL